MSNRAGKKTQRRPYSRTYDRNQQGRALLKPAAVFTALLVLTAALIPGCSGEAGRAEREAFHSPAAEEPWPHYRGDPGQTGERDIPIPRRVRIDWSFQTGDNLRSSPVAAENRLFIGSDDGFLYALDFDSGEELWRYEAGSRIEAPPLFHQGRIFFGTGGGIFLSLEAETGELLWSFETGREITGSANILNLSPDNGSEPGKRDRSIPGERDVSEPGQGDDSDPAKRGKPEKKTTRIAVIFGSHDSRLYALDRENGELLWEYRTESYINGSPAVAGDKVIFGGCDRYCRVLSGGTGELIHAIDAGSYLPGSGAVQGGRAFFGNFHGRLHAFDILSGEIIWTFGDENTGPFFSSPAIRGGQVFIGSQDNRVYAVNIETGKKDWDFLTGGDVKSSLNVRAEWRRGRRYRRLALRTEHRGRAGALVAEDRCGDTRLTSPLQGEHPLRGG